MNVPKQQVVIELEGATYEAQMENLLRLVGIAMFDRFQFGNFASSFIQTGAGIIKRAEASKPCALCSGPAHSGPCYRDGVNP